MKCGLIRHVDIKKLRPGRVDINWKSLNEVSYQLQTNIIINRLSRVIDS